MSIQNILWLIVLLCILAPLAAMAFEPFFSDFLPLIGWDSAKWARPTANVLSDLATSGRLSFWASVSVAFGAGAICHWIARSIDRATAIIKTGRQEIETSKANAEKLVMRKAVLDGALQEIRNCYQSLLPEREWLQSFYDDLTINEQDEETAKRELTAHKDRWETNLRKIEIAANQAGVKNARFVLTDAYKVSYYPLKNWGHSREKQARDERLFWDQLAKLEHDHGAVVGVIGSELKEIDERIRRLGSNFHSDKRGDFS